MRAARARPEPEPDPLLAGAGVLDAERLRALCLAAGADDVGFVEIDRPELADQRADIEAAFPHPKALISFLCRTNREAVRSPARSAGNLEFHRTYDVINEVAAALCARLERAGVRALNPAAGFPMEMGGWPGKIWVVGHKPVAVAAGLGRMGIHRNVIHPKFGNFVLLGTVVLGAEVTAYDSPINFNPCLECKLCVTACPTGAISKTGEFNFSACATHNYRDFLSGFGDWVETVADAGSVRGYRDRVEDTETVSMWQSLSFGPQYKAAYCVSVCPAGDDVIGPYLENRRAHLDDVLNPLRDKPEPVYVLPGSDAESYVPKHFPAKTVRHAGLGIRPATIAGFALGLPLLFQPGVAGDLDAVYHLVFTGAESREMTVRISGGQLSVDEGLRRRADLRLRADADTWIRFLGGRASLPLALLRGRLRLRGDPRLLLRFARCFPS